MKPVNKKIQLKNNSTLNKLFIEAVHVFVLRLTAGLFLLFFRESGGFSFREGARGKELVSRALVFLLRIA